MTNPPAARPARWVPSIALATCCLILPTALAAVSSQDLPAGRFFFRTLGSEQGLGNLGIEDVDQDESGFLWVATQDGLYRYDGQKFQRFGVEEGLPGNWITSVLTGPGDQLWVGTRNGLAWREGDRFVAAPPSSPLPRTYVNELALDGGGRLWIATPQGLFRRDPDGTIRAAAGWPGGEATTVFANAAQADSLYAAQGQRVGKLDARGSWTFWDTRIGLGESIDALIVDGGGRLWASTPQHLLSRGPADLDFHDETAALATRFNTATRSVLALDREGNLWVPTGSGLFQRRDRGWRQLGPEAGLPGNSAEGVFFDREGSLWVWQLGIGLHRQLGRGMWESWTQAEGLPANIVWSVYRDRSGTLWVGTNDGLVQASQGGWRIVPGTAGLAIRRIAEAADGTLWLGAKPTQILHFSPGNGHLQTYGEEQGVAGKRLLDVLVDRHGGIWVATFDAGLRHLADGAERFERIATPFDSQDGLVSAIQEDAEGRLWIASRSSLAVREAGAWRVFPPPARLPEDGQVYFLLAPHQDIWLGYGRPLGVERLNFEHDSPQSLELRPPAVAGGDSIPYSLGLDRLGRIWMGTGRGVDVLTAAGSDHFDTSDGLVGEDCTHLAFWADANGDVFVGTSSGLSRMHAARYPGPPAPPRTRILQATVGNQALHEQPGSAASFERHLNTFEVAFASLSFVNDARLEHQVRLVGLEDDWHTSQVRQSRYPALPAGRYRFEARARFGDGPWGPAAAIPFDILPAWWETWPARSLGLALVMVAIFGVFKARERQLRQRQLELEAVIEARTAELNEANARLQRLAATDGLTGLANRRAFDQGLELELRRAQRLQGQSAILLVDVDHFKAYNDTYGHVAGDQCLRLVAQALSEAAGRAGDLVARFGGEEFAILLPNTDSVGAATLGERTRLAVAALELPHTGSSCSPHVTISVGAASSLSGDGSGAEDLVRWADAALYRSKVEGRNRTTLHEIAPAPVQLRGGQFRATR